MVIQLNKKYYFYDNLDGLEQTKSFVIVYLNENKLTFDYEIYDDVIFAPYTNDNDDLFNHDVVEIFISFSGRRDEYYEYELSPNGKRFFGLIKNPSLCSPKLKRIKPEFEQSITLTKFGYKASITLNLDKDIKLDNILLNCFYVDSSGTDVGFYSINPTKNKSFHLSSYLCPLNK